MIGGEFRVHPNTKHLHFWKTKRAVSVVCCLRYYYLIVLGCLSDEVFGLQVKFFRVRDLKICVSDYFIVSGPELCHVVSLWGQWAFNPSCCYTSSQFLLTTLIGLRHLLSRGHTKIL